MSLPFTSNIAVLDGVSSTTTSSGYDISKRQLKSIQFSTGAGTSISAVFVVDVSNDNTNWVRYNRLTDNVTNAITEGDVRVSTSSTFVTTNAAKFYFFPTGDYFRAIRATVTIGAGSDATASATLQAGG